MKVFRFIAILKEKEKKKKKPSRGTDHRVDSQINMPYIRHSFTFGCFDRCTMLRTFVKFSHHSFG